MMKTYLSMFQVVLQIEPFGMLVLEAQEVADPQQLVRAHDKYLRYING